MSITVYSLNWILEGKNGRTKVEPSSLSMLDKNALKKKAIEYLNENHALSSICVGFEIVSDCESTFTSNKDQNLTFGLE